MRPGYDVTCAGDLRPELLRILHDTGFSTFCMTAMKVGRSEQVDYGWCVLMYTTAAGMALGKTTIPLCHRCSLARSCLPSAKSSNAYPKAIELLKQYKLLETKSCSHESGSKATPVLKKVRQCSNQPACVEAVECAGYAPA